MKARLMRYTNRQRRRLRMIVLVHVIFVTGISLAQEVILLDEIVARINEEIITWTDLKKKLHLVQAELTRRNPDPQVVEKLFKKGKRELLQTLIEEKLLLQKAEELGVEEDIEVQVEEQLEGIRKQSGIPTMKILEEAVSKEGISLEEFRKNLRNNIIKESLLRQYVYSRIVLLTPEVEAYYQENLDQFTKLPEVELEEILLLTEGKDKALVWKEMEKILAKLQLGASFKKLAKQYSDGPSASRGGDIGAFKKGSMHEAVEKVVFDLEPGEISGIIETEYGLQIVKVLDKKPLRHKTLEEVRPQIQDKMYRSKAQPYLEKFLRELRQENYIYIAPKYRQEYNVEKFGPFSTFGSEGA